MYSEHSISDKPSLQYDIPTLKILALNHMRSELAKCNIVEEAFSRFASRSAARITGVNSMLIERHRYDEMRSLYANQLASVWMDDSTTETTRTSVDEKINSFAKGKLEHASEVLSALFEIVSRDGDINAPSGVSPAVRLAFSCVAQECLLRIIRPHRSRALPTGPL